MATFQINTPESIPKTSPKQTTKTTLKTKSYHQQQQQKHFVVLSPSKTRRRWPKQENSTNTLWGNHRRHHTQQHQEQQQQLGFQCTQHHQQQQHRHLCSRSTSNIAAASTVALTRRRQRRCPALSLTTATIARLLPQPPPTLTSTTLTSPAPPQSASTVVSFSKFNFNPTDTLFMMITMLVVVTVVISGNAVFAAQRDSYKPKDLNSLSNNKANAIPNTISGTGNAVSNGNTNNVSNGNTNSNSASSNSNTTVSTNNSNNNSYNSTTSSNSMTSSSSSSTTTTTATAVLTTSTHSTSGIGSSSSSSGSSTISSSSLHKGGGSAIGINRNTIEIQEDIRNGPYFDKAASKNVTALLGKTAYLNCRVKNLGNKTMLLQVSWVRHRDIHLLTVGRYTYTSDQRFRAIHQPQTEDWILQIKYPQHRDSGIYECQVSTTPHMSHYIHLNVVEPSTEIIGAPDLYIESGSTINLTCVILNSPEPPAYIFWNHNNAIINYDSPRGGVSVVTNKGETTTSFLLIKSARPSDSGHYQCNPSNAKAKTVTVHVLNGEFPAAMQHAALSHHRMSPSHYLLVYLSIYCCSLAYVRRYMQLHVPAVN